MKNQQGKHIVGHVTFYVKGNKPERFFEYCALNGIIVWDIQKIALDECKGTIYLQTLKKVKHLIEETPYEISSVKSPKGLRPAIKRLWQRKEILITACLCALLLFSLSNIAWELDINGVSEESEKKIKETLKDEGLYKGAWTYNLDDLNKIQQEALHALPELMYIGISENGTTYHVDAIEKRQEKKGETLPKRDLVASKDGEIKSIFIKNGISKVAVHDIVQKGDLLVSGKIEDEITEDEEGDKEENETPEQVAAEGEIYANTWYEMDVTSSIKPSQSSLTGEKHERVHVNVFGLTFPVWGFKQPFSDYIKKAQQHTLQLFNYEFPVSVETEVFHEAENKVQEGNIEEARERAVQHIEDTLQRKAGEEAEILSYKVLHERTENGKVNINLYVSVLENIVQEKEIN